MAKTTPSPDVMTMMTITTLRAADAAAKGESRMKASKRYMDKSGQGPRRAVAKAVARPMGIQPDINRHLGPLLQ